MTNLAIIPAELPNIDSARWVSEARKSFVPSNREPCQVCGKYKSLTQAHHLVPLSKMSGKQCLMKAAELRRMGSGCYQHADELDRYVTEHAA